MTLDPAADPARRVWMGLHTLWQHNRALHARQHPRAMKDHPYSVDCDCGACQTQELLNDPQATADIEEGLADIAAGRTVSLEEFKAIIDATRPSG